MDKDESDACGHCVGCDKRLCSVCAMTCAESHLCGVWCEYCAPHCSSCESVVCEEHLLECFDCGNKLCPCCPLDEDGNCEECTSTDSIVYSVVAAVNKVRREECLALEAHVIQRPPVAPQPCAVGVGGGLFARFVGVAVTTQRLQVAHVVQR